MFPDDFITEVNAMDMLSINVLHDSRVIKVHQASGEQMVAQGLNRSEILMFKAVWARLINPVRDKATKQLVYSRHLRSD